MAKPKTLTFENARIGFRNFSGKEGKYNRAGDRNFVIFLDPAAAEEMAKDGWNVKQLKARPDDEEEPPYYLQVKVRFDGGRPPKIVMITSRGKSPVDESMVDILDWAEFTNVDLIINPYEWEVQGSTGLSAYLKSMYVTLYEDELDLKYADVADSGRTPTVIENPDDAPPF